MKTRSLILSIIVFAMPGIAWSAHGYSASVEIQDVSYFYKPLAPYGHWVEVAPYGWCWYPAYVQNGWRPYTNGHWLWTDGGWYWVSDEPWAWACYHYGRWVWHSYYGWLWVPGIEWAPAWVCWREGGGYIGWAPLPPDCDFAPHGVIYAGQIVVAPRAFVFVERHRFCEPIRPSILIINTTIIHQTINITKIKRVNKTVINEGPDVDHIRRVSSREVPTAKIEQVRTRYEPVPAVRDEPVPAVRDEPLPAVRDERPHKARERREIVVHRGADDHDARPAVVPLAPPQRQERAGDTKRFRTQTRPEIEREVLPLQIAPRQERKIERVEFKQQRQRPDRIETVREKPVREAAGPQQGGQGKRLGQKRRNDNDGKPKEEALTPRWLAQ